MHRHAGLELEDIATQANGGPSTSLEDILQAKVPFGPSHKPSWTSSRAHVPLPESRNPSLESKRTSPIRANHDGHGHSNNSHVPESTRRAETDAKERSKEAPSSPRRHIAFVDDAGPEPSPLWYKSQLFPRRYGSSTHRDPLLSPPRRSSTFPAQLPSQVSKSADDDLIGISRRPSTDNPVIPEPSPAASGPKFDSLLRSHTLPVTSPREKQDGGPPVHISNDNDKEVPPAGQHTNSNDDVEALEHSDQHSTSQISNGADAEITNKATIPVHQPLALAPGGQPPPTIPLIVTAEPKSPTSRNEDSHPSRPSRRRTGDPNETSRHHRRSSQAQPVFFPRARRHREARPPPPPPPINYHYTDLVDRLAIHMPHLINMRIVACRERHSGKIHCYDSLQSGGLPRLIDYISLKTEQKESRELLDRIEELKPERRRNVRCRYLLVEDLSPRVIEYLGSTFWLNPEFFEEHLNRSGYMPNSYEDPLPTTWNTSAAPKDYVSVRWFRPVRRARIKPLSELERDELLMRNNGSGIVKWFQGHFDNTVRLTTNIFRQEWPIVSDPDQAVLDEDGQSAFPVAWEEKVTIQVSQAPGRPPVFIILLDPLPTLDLKSEELPKTKKSSVARSNLVPFLQAYSRAPLGPKLGLIDIFNGRPLDDRAIAHLGENLASTHCTREDLTSWLRSIHGVQPDNEDMDLLTGLLWIIHRDVIGFLIFVNSVLEEIGLNATDDYIIQKRLAHWRNLISRFQTELPAIRLSIKEFFRFLLQFQPLHQAEDFIAQTLLQIDDMIEQNEKSYAALRADMALLESKRAINQAESVGKLTELGFFFIPISCVAALFSMQVQPLSQPVPLYSFVIAAVLTIGLIFTVRLGIRSTALIEYKRETSRKIRLRTKLPPSSPIPTRTFVFYMLGDRTLYFSVFRPLWGPISIILLGLTVFISLMLPVIFLWVRNRGMDVSYKSTLTILFFIVAFATVFSFMRAYSDSLFAGQTDRPNLLKGLRLMRLLPGAPNTTRKGTEITGSDVDNSGTDIESRPAKRGFVKNLARRMAGRRRRRDSDTENEIYNGSHAQSSPTVTGGAAEPSRREESPRNPPLSRPVADIRAFDPHPIRRWRNNVDALSNVDSVETIDVPLPRVRRSDDESPDAEAGASLPRRPTVETVDVSTVDSEEKMMHGANPEADAALTLHRPSADERYAMEGPRHEMPDQTEVAQPQLYTLGDIMWVNRARGLVQGFTPPPAEDGSAPANAHAEILDEKLEVDNHSQNMASHQPPIVEEPESPERSTQVQCEQCKTYYNSSAYCVVCLYD